MSTADERGRDLSALLGEATEVAWSEQDVLLATSPEEWLIVESGQVDLFLVTIKDGTTHGPWRSLCRLGAGGVVAGPVAGPRHRILLRRVEDATVQSVVLPSLRTAVRAELAEHDDSSPALEALASGVESTVRAIAHGLRSGPPPRDFVALSSGSRLELQAGDMARSVEGLLWVDVTDGHVQVNGQLEQSHRTGDVLCLTRQDWLTMRGVTRLSTADTHEIIANDQVWRRLVTHYTRFLYAIDRSAEHEERAALERLERISDRDAQVLDTVRAENDRLMQTEANADPVAGHGVVAGHVSAVQRVLRVLHAPTDVPPEVVHRRDITDFDDLGSGGWVRTRPLKLEGQWWTEQMGPLVGYWGLDHLPAAFVPYEGGYLVEASWLDTPVRVTRENKHQAGKAAWVVYPRLPADVSTVKGLLRHGLSGLRSEFWLFGTMATLVGLLGLLTPILNGQVLGSFVASANRSMIIQGGLAVIASALVAGAFSIVQNLAILRIQGSMTAKTQTGVWSRLMDLPVTFFHKYSSGRLGTIVLSVKAAEEVLSGVVVAAALGLIVASANLLLIFYYSLQLALVGVGLVVVALAVCWLAGRRLMAVEEERYEADQQLSAMSYETLSAISKIRGAAAEERAFLRWSVQQRAVQAKQLESRRIQDVVTVFNGMYPVLALAAVFTTANMLSTAVPLPALLSFMTAFTLLLNALLQFTGSVLTAAAMVPMMGSLRPILEAETETGLRKAHPGDLNGQVTLRQVSFRYGADGPLVLEDVNLDIRPGEFVAIVGASGSGKSTIIRLLLGFERPHSGSILFDGQDLGELDLAAVRRQCGVVLQSGALMPGDIRDNIAGGGRYTEDDIWEAAEMAGLADVIKEMPMGLSTVVNETSHGLSGGQIQRLMIARALVNRPRIVIFDEATSALDNPTQQIVAEATHQLNATRLVVAHRLSTVRDADRIFVMEDGKVVQEGTYEELMETEEGVFAGLARRQAS
ncbi:NHLP bacteriocin export ABC transporter permease/ATPase subunit [Ornithinimicrobium faecis]|uniref:NHLP bacteriocin export ABC transporter permease/ATPase subunit n=1 Tax=Ornithinimicrobium faecis TaxID=2934158 RepID=A0ABY4YYN5_9MICO|nr:NHLP bacteriocin export ABC transporter permease/ATPase subunit [Ornithinimicrobium sp. HY1793]USQ81856.1 NHLP bacteriocin export ABC transporter permease/ATPase subunit [Ornithinimicrobium sp. HY1793]